MGMGDVTSNFTIRPEAAVQTDPFGEGFFIGPSDSDFDHGHVAPLVRESFRNAARVAAAPVRVTFALHVSHVRQTCALRYLTALAPHLGALPPPVPWPWGGANNTIWWLVYEDLHATGLCGNPAIVDDPPAGHERREDFYWFWRNVTRRAKTGEKLGRWGLGNTIFHISNNVNCIIGLTWRSADNRLPIRGQAVLRNPPSRGKQYLPCGLLSDPSVHRRALTPFVGTETATYVVSAFRSHKDGEPRLSLVVRFVRDVITAEAMAPCVCIHIFIRILHGECVVETMDECGDRCDIAATTSGNVVRQLRQKLRDDQQQVNPPSLDLARLTLERLATVSLRP
jgi:hypothetical protein